MARIAPYAEQHKLENLKGPGDSRPTAVQIIEDQGLVADPTWSGRVVLITGCSPGGIGPETARAIRLTGADIYITSRELSKGKQVSDDLLADGKPGKVEVIQMDLSSLDSVRAAVKEFLQKSGNKLNILINNAGVMACPQGKTKDGFETQFGINHLAHFLLFNLLKDALLASATPSFNSRVVSVASGAHRNGEINFDDLNLEHTEYNPIVPYRQSKLANVLFSNELDRRYKEQNLRGLSLNPGGILTPLLRHLPSTDYIHADKELSATLKNPSQGAATTVWAAVAKEWEGKGGVYLDECAEGWLTPEDAPYYHGGYAPQAFDPPTEKRLWEVSLKLVGLSE
ncbi:short chain dehydrogenase [Xylaria bambusicola]|uniref:short chain dehydrogenase n=1 Tax=Xylaria bambusicola TaxID=326684 RepID=UPI00200723AC|nr:short chain dehydrogenase [Xylaria bambusicola]KAI0516982.1 short chain dehydrogenase [Xylaria bambusicola]